MMQLEFQLALPSFTLAIDVTLTGKVTAILGPSGSGKTSLLEVMAGLRKRAVGRIAVDDATFLDSNRGVRAAPEKRHVGYVPQEPALFPHLDVGRNVRYGLRPLPDSETGVDDVLSMLEIGGLAHRYPRTLSGGEAQRVALARALVTRPRLLLLDEPLAALDAELKGRILPYLLRVRDETKVPIIYVTHHAGEALALADEAMVLRHGRVEAKGPVAEVLTPKILRGEATFENIVHGVIAETHPEAGTATVASDARQPPGEEGRFRLAVPSAADLRVGQRVTYRVASEDILLLRRAPEGISARNVFPAEVVDIEAFGHDALVVLRAHGIDWRARLTPAAIRELEVRTGAQLWVAIMTHSFEKL